LLCVCLRAYRHRPGANTLKSVIHRRVIIQYLPLIIIQRNSPLLMPALASSVKEINHLFLYRNSGFIEYKRYLSP
jgi:hypothetical protein